MFNCSIQPKICCLLLILLLLTTGGCNINQTFSEDNNNQIKQQLGDRLKIIKQRGKLICGVSDQIPGFNFKEKNGEYTGISVDLCRALAVALFDEPSIVEYRNLNAEERFTAVASGQVDLLSSNTTWTLNRDTTDGLEFAPTTFYDGQGLLVGKNSNIEKLADINGKSVCVASGTTSEQNLAEQMRKLGLNYSPILFEDTDKLYNAYESNRCDAATSDRSELVARRVGFTNPNAHEVLDLVLSKEPLGAAIADGEPKWFDVVKWTTYATIKAEELGINSQNIDSYAQTNNPEIRRFLGIEGGLGADLGLANDFAKEIIQQVGNYGEIYDRNIGKPFSLKRGKNALWKNGGLIYSPPFR